MYTMAAGMADYQEQRFDVINLLDDPRYVLVKPCSHPAEQDRIMSELGWQVRDAHLSVYMLIFIHLPFVLTFSKKQK